MPKDDGDFYQFCYVAEAGKVQGFSLPFQFEDPMTDDVAENEDEDGELSVISVEVDDQLRRLV